jgi:hypothetical protein
MADKYDPNLEETIARQQNDLDRLKDALGLLGVHECAPCKRFFRRTDPGTLFDAGGELVCYGCIREWWTQRYDQLEEKERQNIEGKLVFWLRDYHHAESFKDPAKLPPSSDQELSIDAKCLECKGVGKLGEEPCRYCEGRGKVWVVVSRRKV